MADSGEEEREGAAGSPRPEPTPAQLVELEREAYEKAARELVETTEGLLRFIDKDLEGTGFSMPAFDDPLDAATYIAGIVEIRRTAQDTRHRGRLIERITRFTVWWIAFVVLIVVLSAVWPHFDVSDEVLIVLLSTTTANVLGLAVIVLKGMFEAETPDHLRPLPPAKPVKNGGPT